MMERSDGGQEQMFYSCLEEVVPDHHLARGIAAVLALSWVRAELAPYYPSTVCRERVNEGTLAAFWMKSPLLGGSRVRRPIVKRYAFY